MWKLRFHYSSWHEFRQATWNSKFEPRFLYANCLINGILNPVAVIFFFVVAIHYFDDRG